MPLDSSTNSAAGVAPPGSIWDYVGPAIQAGAGVGGFLGASGAGSGGYNTAAGTIRGAVNTSGAALSPYSTTGSRAESALANLYGIGGSAPDFSAFTSSPGYQFQVDQGNQAIQRAANASGNGFSSTTLAQLGKYNSGLASTHYNDYIQGLYGLTQTGAGAAANLGGQAIQGATAQGNAQANAGMQNASGIMGAAGSIAGAAGKLPWGQIGSGVSSLFGGGNAGADMASYFGSDYGTGGWTGQTAADLGGYGADGASNVWDLFGGGFNGAGGQAATAGRPQQQSQQQQQPSNPVKTAADLYGYYNKATKAYNFLTGAGNIGASASAAVAGLGSELAASTAAAEGGVASSVAASNAAWLAAQPAAAGAGLGTGGAGAAAGAANAAGAGSSAAGSSAAAGSLGLGMAGVALAAAPAIYGASRNPVDLHASYWQGIDKTLQAGKSDPQYWNTVTQLLGMKSQDPVNSPQAAQMLAKYGISFYQNPNVTQGASVSRVGSRPTQKA